MRLLIIFVRQVDSGSIVNQELHKRDTVMIHGQVKGCPMRGYFIDIYFRLVHEDFHQLKVSMHYS